MLYHLFGYLDRHFDFIGAGVFKYISFRAVGAIVLSLLITIVFGKTIIRFLQRKQIGETIRELGLEGQSQKKGTPTMGGLIIIAGILIPVLLLARIDNIYIILLCLATVWLGLIGFLDDYIKVFRKNKSGLNGRFKIIGQIGLGLAVGIILFYHQDVRIREYNMGKNTGVANYSLSDDKLNLQPYQDHKSLKTTIPFVKNNEMDYDRIFSFLGADYVWLGYSILVILVITAVSNGANITDGIDGLAAGTSAIIALTLGILAYVSGNTVFAQYLNIMYIPDSGEIVVFCAAFLGACIGFLWYNAYPAQVFMGDTGSLSIGGIIAVLALCIRKEWLIPVLCGIFLVENLSVLLQVAYFKYTRIRFGAGKRIFLMAPLHHHYQKKSYHESKIVIRFWIIGILLAAITLSTLKLR